MKKKIVNALLGMVEASLKTCDISGPVNDALGSSDLTANLVSQLSTVMYQIQDAMEAGALAIALLFFILALIELAMSERMTLEFMIKFFSKLVVSIALILNCRELTEGIMDLGTAFVNTIGSLGGGGSVRQIGASDLAPLREEMMNGNDWVGLLFALLIPCIIIRLVGMILHAVVYIIAFTRLLELHIRGAFLPIALALIADDGWKGAAGRYIKKFIAIVCQGAMLLVIGNLSTTLIGAAMNNMMTNLSLATVLLGMVVPVAAGLATVSIMFKSIGLINDVFGA